MSFYTSIYDKLNITSSVSITIISIAIMLFSGFLLTRVTKLLKLPNVTAYIVAGILIGPYVLDLIPTTFVEGTSFLADIALAFIAFSTGEFFKLDVLKKNGVKVLIITVFEALLATIVVFCVCYFILHLDLAFSVVLGALASATAPASTMMTIRQTKAKGDFVDTLLQVVALDDVVGLIAFSIATSIAAASSSGNVEFMSVIRPILYNILALIIGGLFGYSMKFLLSKKRTKDNRLIISIAMLFTFCGLCTLLDISSLLGCMCMGMVYINVTNDDKLFKQLNYFSPPILLLFFVRSGVSFNLSALFSSSSIGSTPIIIIGVVYFLTRIIGKYGGAYLGCLATNKDKKVRNYLGLALIPQAGVAIGLASLGARIIGGDAGAALETIILASSVLYELIGPACAKLSLYLSKSYGTDEVEEAITPIEEKIVVDDETTIIDEIQEIQKNMPMQNLEYTSEEEAAFLEAADELYSQGYKNNNSNKR